MTGVDKLHSEGVFGDGIIVGVLDTGVDYTHPALGGCFGPGCKIGGGTDLVGNNYTGFNTPVPGIIPFLTEITGGPDPLDQCAGHGTHVSGTILADARNANASQPFIGVAPGATIFMYRIFGCNGSVSSDVIIASMALAFADGVDIISMSLGGVNGWSENAETVVANRLADRGVFMSIAAGNDGANGLFEASAPATATDVMAIASVDDIALVAWNSLTEQGKTIVTNSINLANI
jgi:subtilisin family serine protease